MEWINNVLRDIWWDINFSLCFTRAYKKIWEVNLVVHQKTLTAFFFMDTGTFDWKYVYKFLLSLWSEEIYDQEENIWVIWTKTD